MTDAPFAGLGALLHGPSFRYFNELVRRVRRVIIVFVAAIAFFSTVGLAPITVNGLALVAPYPSLYNSISVGMVRAFEAHAVPQGMQLLNINAFDSMFASAEVSLLLGLLVVAPFAASELHRFVAPALYEGERRFIRSIALVGGALFAVGAALAYMFVLPLFFGFVKTFAVNMGAEPTMSVGSFMGMALALILVFGLAMETPVAMAMLTRLGFIRADTWKRNWRWGAVGSFAVALFISPGSSGGIMESAIGVTVFALYVVGIVVARLLERRGVKAAAWR